MSKLIAHTPRGRSGEKRRRFGEQFDIEDAARPIILAGDVCYDPDNHQRMTDLRWQKVLGIQETMPTPEVQGPEKGDLLVVGWGSTKGAVDAASQALREDGKSVANMHLRHLWPLPKGLSEIFANYSSVLVPELNGGQLWRILRSEYPQHNFILQSKVEGRPFTTGELVRHISSTLEH